MSLGGYKFAGHRCNKDSLTDLQWILRMHKTKVTAFLEASDLASAGWEYDMTGSPDGNYHCLDSVGNNYVTCFKNTAKGSYFAIYTLTKYTCNENPTSDAVYAPLFYGRMTGNYYYFGAKSNSYYCAQSSSSIPYSSVPSNPVVMPVTFCYGISSYSRSSYYGYSDTLFSATTNYYGFAIKGDDIIILAGSDITASTLNVSLMSMSGLLYTNEGDTYKEFSANFQLESSSYTEKSRNYSDHWEYGFIRDLLGNTVMPACAVLPMAIYKGAVQEYPFQDISVFLHNEENLYKNTQYKGRVKIELLAVNGQFNDSSSAPVLLKSVANGNFLTICNGTSTRTYTTLLAGGPYNGTISSYKAVYCGWDASNPDITLEASWPVYTDV